MIPMHWFQDLAEFFAVYHDKIQEEGLMGAIESYAYDSFIALQNWFFSFLSSQKGLFRDMGKSAINTFTFEFNDSFIVTVIGLIFGFFVFKFILGKVLDLVGRWLDPM